MHRIIGKYKLYLQPLHLTLANNPVHLLVDSDLRQNARYIQHNIFHSLLLVTPYPATVT